ncbi:MAG: hypothetical protein C4K60_04795 [Ideonella sp. MAG2]|nr:MAG: hypothetical protein C4K60_04795 [Ideonella sp. MAG2]
MNALAGLLVGLVVGVTGVGGGALMTPILVLVFGVSPQTAVGTDLLYASITKMFGVGVHHNHGTVDWQVVKRLACGSLPAAALTLAWMSFSVAALAGSTATTLWLSRRWQSLNKVLHEKGRS